ncbi:MAG: aminotransferase class III-fold pyridoxal phosphate-dependent enzyme, partial [Terriglobus sp.]
TKYPIAAIILEPILQNIGVVKPKPAYLQGLRALADELGFLLIFDEVKTGFRHALGGYAALSGVNPDLAVYGKAIANGYPVAAIGGRKDILELFSTADASKRVLLAGTYNAHPVMVAAAVATIQQLMSNDGAIYRHFEEQGAWLQNALEAVGKRLDVEMVVARQGSALCPYFMDHLPMDWYDLASHHNFDMDQRVRQQMIADGVYVFPIAVKQWSISAAHTQHELERAVEAFEAALLQERDKADAR